MIPPEDHQIDAIHNPSPTTGSIEATLSAAERKVLKAFEGRENDILSPEDIQGIMDFSGQVEVMNAISWLRSKHLVNMREIVRKNFKVDKEGKDFLENGTPEKKTIIALHRAETGEMRISELGQIVGKSVSIAVGWLRRKGWASIRKEEGETILTITDSGRNAALEEEGNDPDKVLLGIIGDGIDESDVPSEFSGNLKDLLSRKGVIRVRDLVFREVSLTEPGRDVLANGIVIRPEVSTVSTELLKNGKWKDVDIRPYDITAFAPKVRRGTIHPLTILIEDIREIFVSMGFTEIQGEYIESCFWNMDVLFIPQDHPARELQDTFYLKRPDKVELKDDRLVQTIKEIHETGGDTGSSGWNYTWRREEGERSVLRTHTTVNTIRYLSKHPDPPVKVFSLGRVFRKESIDATHLPEFHQIEGILMEEGASFGMLIGLLKEFYARMGFKEIRFRPSYYPYTEPSMDVEVRFRGKWLELGGSGIFRQEVTSPFGIKHPVLAWGLGLERLAMLRLGLKDIRDLYISDIDWLQEAEGKL